MAAIIMRLITLRAVQEVTEEEEVLAADGLS